MLAPLMAYGPFAATAKARHDIIAGGGVALTAEQSAALYKARVDAEKARVEKERGVLVGDIAAIEAKQAKIDSYKQSAVDARAAEAARLEQSLRNQGITITGYDARGMPQYAFSPWTTQTLAMSKQREALESAIKSKAEGQRVESEMRNALYKEYQDKNIAGRASQLSFDIQTYFSPQQAKAVEAAYERAGVTSAASRLQAGLPTAQVPFPLFARGPPTIAGKPVTWSPDVRQSLSPELQEGAVYVGAGNVPQHRFFPQAERYGPGWSREAARNAAMQETLMAAEGTVAFGTVPFMGGAALAAGGVRGAAGLGVALAGGTVAAGGARVVAEPFLESRGVRGTSRELALFPIELGAGIAGGYATSKFVSPRFVKSFENTFLKGTIKEELSFGKQDYIDMLIGPKQKSGVIGIEAMRTRAPKSVEFEFPFLGYEKGAGFVGTSEKFDLKPAEIWFGKKYFRGAQKVSAVMPERFAAMQKIGVAEPRLLSVEIFGKEFVKEKSIFGVPQKGGLPVGAEEWIMATKKGKLDVKTRHFAQTGAVSLEQAEFVKSKITPVMTEELVSGDFVGMARKGKEIGFRQFGGPGEYKTFIETFATEKGATARIKGEVKIRGSMIEEELYRWREKAPYGIEVPVPKKGGYTPLRFAAPKESVEPTADVLKFRKALQDFYAKPTGKETVWSDKQIAKDLEFVFGKPKTLAGAKEINRYTALLEQDVHAILSPRKGVAAIGGTLPGKGISGKFFFEEGLVGELELKNAPLRFTILEEGGIPKMPKGAGVATGQKSGLVQLQEHYRKENLALAVAEKQEMLRQEKLAKIQMETVREILGVGAKAGPAILQAKAYEVPGSYAELSKGLPRVAKTPVEQLWEKEYSFLLGLKAKAGPMTQEDLTAKQLASMTGLPIENFRAPTTGTQLGIAGLPKEYFHPPQQPLRPEFVPAEGRKFGRMLGVSPRQQAAINESLGIGVSARTKAGFSQAQKEILGLGQEVSPATAARNAQKEMQRLFGAQKVSPGQRVSTGQRIDLSSMLNVSARLGVAHRVKTAQRLAQPQRISLFEIAPPPPPPPIVPGGGIGWLPPIAPKVQSAKAFLKSIMPGFDVFVRREGKAKRINPFPLVEESAKGMGAKAARETLARTFWIEPTGRAGKRLPQLEDAFKGEQFRRPKGKSRLPAGAFVEKSRFALDVAGEKRAIKAARLESLLGFFPLRKKKKAELLWG